MVSNYARPKLPLKPMRMLIGGELVESISGKWFDAINPADEEVIGSLPLGCETDTLEAVTAAEKAQPAWAALSVARRTQYINQLVEAIAKRAEELVPIEVLDTGNPIKWQTGIVDRGLRNLQYFTKLGTELSGKTFPASPENLHVTVREPYGVVGLLCPFNHPLTAAMRIGAPLITGNTVVIKPSEHTSLSAAVLAEIYQQILPPGVVNIVNGYGRDVGAALVRHPRIKRIALTGSVETGLAIQRTGAESAIKHMTMELGGKNPMIVFPDADLSKAIPAAVAGMNLGWQGQSCSSTSRLLLHESIHDEVLGEVVKQFAAIHLADPLTLEAAMGPVNNQSQYEKVKYYIEAGQEDGAKLMTGGKRPAGSQFERGYWIEPAVFTDVKPNMRIAREEIFGPVLSVIKWKTEDEALEIANSLDVGLSASIWSKDFTTAIRAARRVQAGLVWVNGRFINSPPAPFGGFKNSGLGREGCHEELLSFTEEKTIHFVL